MAEQVKVLRVKQAAAFRIVEKRYEGSFSLARHRHEIAYVSFLLAGSYVELSGRGEVACPSGTVIWHPSTEAHSDRFHPQGAHLLDLEIAECWLREAAQSLKPQLDSRVFCGGLPYSLGLKAYRSLSAPDSRIEDAVTELLSFFFSGDTDRTAPAWFKRALELLEEDECHRQSMTGLAHRVGVHPVHLSRSFRRFLRCTFGDHLAKVRIRRALELLRTSHSSVADVAYACGFADHSHLCRIFKQSTGLSPTAFRAVIDSDC